jgi:tetratricopeptide (TPR) repeat protein
LTTLILRVTIVAEHEGRVMPSGPGERYDFFLSRRGSVAPIAREVENVLSEKGYRVFVQDYDIPIAANFIEEVHEALKNARDLVVLFTRDYEQSPYTRMEFTGFEANAAQSAEHRRMVILRCEDVPLLGLFAPHVYQDLVGIGEAEERRSRILAAVEGRSQALEPPARPFIGVPPRIASFTGRADELDRLDAILIQEKPAAVTHSVGRAAVQGMGGVGKTALAVEYAHRFRGLYAGVCWCPAETPTGLLSALANLAVTLDAAKPEEADVEKAAKAALRRLAEQRATWLLVYDNVPAPDAIADLLPSAGARVLITSRFSDWSELADEVALDVLAIEEAVALLRSRTGRGYAGAQTVAEVLGCLPLALDHAAAYCKRTQMRFADYARKAWSLIDAAPRGAGYPRSVGATFDLAITEAVEQCRAAETLMAYLAQCAPERIPMTLVGGAVEDELERMEALAALAEVSLLKHDQFDDRTPAVTVHRLVQAVARARSEANGSAQETVGKLIGRLTASYPEDGYDNPQSWPLCAKLTPHLLARRGADDASVFHLLGRTGEYFHGRAAYSQAAPLLRDALAICEKTLGPEHRDTAGSLNNLANVLRAQGDLAGARPLFERALAISEKVLGPEHPDTAISLTNLANLLWTEGDLVGARPLFERALAIREKSLGPEHPRTATSLNNLAGLLSAQGDLTAARPLFERALAIYEKALGPEHPKTATSLLNNLAQLLQAQGDLAGVRSLFERALAINEKVLGPEHPHTAICLNNLALLLQAQGDLAGAKPLYERTLAIREKVLGPEHPETASSLNNLANLLQDQGDLAGAKRAYERALAIHEKALGPQHPHTATSLNNLARLLQVQGDFLGSRPLFEHALAIREKALGPEHPDTATSLNNLASLLHDQGDLASARPLLERALAIVEKALGPEHPRTATSLNNLAGLLQAQGDFTGARPLFERALAISEKIGPEHPETAMWLNNLALLLSAQGDLPAARPLFEHALAIREKALGPEHPDTATCLNNLASVLKAQGDFAGARPLYERALAIREKALGPEHSDTAESLNALAVLLSNEGDFAGARLLLKRALAIGASQVKRSPSAKPLSAHTTSHSEETTI